MKLTGHVGFDSLPDQLVNKSVNKGFSFNILCIGMCIKYFICIYLEGLKYLDIVDFVHGRLFSVVITKPHLNYYLCLCMFSRLIENI